MGISLHEGSAGQPGVGLSTGVFGRWLKGALEVDYLILCGNYVKGTWREGSLAGDLEGYVEDALETGISSHGGPIGKPVTWLIYQGLLENDEKGSRDGVLHFEWAKRESLEGGLLYWGTWKIC